MGILLCHAVAIRLAGGQTALDGNLLIDQSGGWFEKGAIIGNPESGNNMITDADVLEPPSAPRQ